MKRHSGGSNFAVLSKFAAILFDRRIFLPWLSSAAVMFALSYLWHGVALTDIDEMRMPLDAYLALTAGAYVLIGLVLSLAVRFALLRDWISLKRGFPMASMLVGTIIGLFVYLSVLVLGVSFAGHALQHMVVDVLWQMFEGSIGGLVVSLGIIHGLHRGFMEAEHAR